jgi:hypothetical protein
LFSPPVHSSAWARRRGPGEDQAALVISPDQMAKARSVIPYTNEIRRRRYCSVRKSFGDGLL